MDAIKFEWIANAFIFSTLGVAIFWAAFILIDKITPYNLWQEIVKEKNVALAILIGCVSLGLCLIIAAAIH